MSQLKSRKKDEKKKNKLSHFKDFEIDAQSKFYELLNQIEQKQAEIQRIIEQAELILKLYNRDIFPKFENYRLILVESAFFFHESLGQINSKNQNAAFRRLILDLLETASTFNDFSPHEYELYSIYAEETEKPNSAENENLNENSLFLNEKNIDTNDSQAEISDVPTIFRKKKRKSKKQILNERLASEKEEISLRSIRKLYLSLAKILHPDTELDETLKGEKEELMKKATAAYEKKDLLSLLQLEIDWGRNEQKHQNLAGNQLQIYTDVLVNQLIELEQTKQNIHADYRYARIEIYLGKKLSSAKQMLRTDAEAFAQTIEILRDALNLALYENSKSQTVYFFNLFQKFFIE